MQVLFYKKEMKKNMKFVKKIYEMKDLDGYFSYFDKFLSNKWKRENDSKMNLEKFLKIMKKSNFFVSKLFINEDKYIPIRHSINARISKKEDSLLEIHCDFNNKNFLRINSVYINTYKRSLISI